MLIFGTDKLHMLHGFPSCHFHLNKKFCVHVFYYLHHHILNYLNHPLPILKSANKTASRALTIDAGPFLANLKDEQF